MDMHLPAKFGVHMCSPGVQGFDPSLAFSGLCFSNSQTVCRLPECMVLRFWYFHGAFTAFCNSNIPILDGKTSISSMPWISKFKSDLVILCGSQACFLLSLRYGIVPWAERIYCNVHCIPRKSGVVRYCSMMFHGGTWFILTIKPI